MVRVKKVLGIAGILAGIGSPLVAHAQDQQAQGGIDVWSALVVLGVLVIALAGLIAYEFVVRTRA